jgi:hypothetical protein
MSWVSFSLSFILSNATYILMTLSDPLGWGWNLSGGASINWHPILTGLIAPMQTLALLIGLLWSASTARRIGSERGISTLPLVVFLVALTVCMAWLLI